tara:strand:+ start:1621 stop:2118 length:498 start_codon:yes stop_codon:yes gene_type:complete
MKKSTLIFFLTLILIGCKSEPKKNVDLTESQKSESEIGQKDSQEFVHLKDTIKISGKTILILRPDSLRFQSYLDSGKEWIYEVDSDFGFGFSTALDSLDLDGVIEEVTEKRYVNILDCKGCPMLVDRDTIDYGFILTKPNSGIDIDNNVFSSEYYIQEFQNYFKN